MPYTRVLFVVVALLAMAVQTLVIQTHVHHGQHAGQVQSPTLIGFVADDPNPSQVQRQPSPDHDDPLKCPFCEQLGHSGQYLAAAAMTSLVRILAAPCFVASSEAATVLAATLRHDWQSRAPPRE